MQLEVKYIKGIELRWQGGTVFIEDVLVDHIGIVGMRLGFIGKLWLVMWS